MREDLKNQVMNIGHRFSKRNFAALMGECNFTDYHVIAEIYKYEKESGEEKVAVSELKNNPMIKHMGVTALSRALKELEDRKLVKREKCCDDKRKTFVRLSSEGRKLYMEKQEIFKAFWDRVFDEFGESHTERLVEELNGLADIVEKELSEFKKNEE